LDYFLARYYSGSQGRFTSPDQFRGGIIDPFTGQQVGQPGPLPYADIADPQTLNNYAYVRNNPLRYVDPDGHDWKDVVETVKTGIDFTAGVGRGIAASISFGLVGAPDPSDTLANRLGQAVGTALAGAGGGEITKTGVGIALVTSETGVGIAVGGGVALAGAAITTGAAKNAGAVSTTSMEMRRAGDFSSSTREGAIKGNAQANAGTNKCENCGQDLVRVKAEKGKTPPGNQLQVHHEPPIKKGGGKDSTPRVLCRDCHEDIHNP